MKKHFSPCASGKHPFTHAVLILMLLFLLIANARLAAQNSKPVYMSITYVKTNPEKHNNYIQLLKTYAQKQAAYHIQQGNGLGWYAYELLMPTGANNEYNVLWAAISTDLKILVDDPTSPAEIYKNIYPDGNDRHRDSLLTSIAEARTNVKKEIFVHTAGLQNRSTAPMPKYMDITYMKPAPGKDAQYVKMEKETFAPLHKERVKLGALAGWELYQKVMPYTNNLDYNYIACNFFNDLKVLEDNKYTEAYKKVFPGQDINKFIPVMESTRQAVKVELWKLITYEEASRL